VARGELHPARGRAQRRGEAHPGGRRERRLEPEQPAQQRPNERLERHERRHRIARQPKERHPPLAQHPEPLRLARLHGHGDEVDLAALAQHCLDDVVDPHADPAGGDDDVDLGGQPVQQRAHLVGVVADAPPVCRVPTCRVDEGSEQVAVGIVDLPRLQRFSRGNELGTGRDDGHPGAGVDRDGGVPRGREQTDMAGRENGPGRQHRAADGEVLTAPTDRRAERGLDENGDDRHTGVGVLHLDDGVGAIGDHGSGHDPGRLAGADRACGGVAGGQIGHDGQPHGGVWGRSEQVRRAHGIPIHRGVVEAGKVDEADDIGSSHETDRRAEREGCGRQRASDREDRCQVLLDRAVSHRTRSRRPTQPSARRRRARRRGPARARHPGRPPRPRR
jgi:hypothetical protein